MIIPENLGIQDITPYVTQTELSAMDADSGGTANVYRGVYVEPSELVPIEIVIKAMRVNTQRRQPENLYRKTQRNLLRELAVWHALQRNPHKNILQLFGVASLPISDYLASVSEFCRFSLVAYFNDPPEKPEYLRFMKEILEGLAHMHNLSPPIIHGDLKFPNILLSFAGVVKICDFGQSRFNNDQRGLASEASFTFQATHRYMSPELFDTKRKVKPTALSDVWAYGCVALQLLSRLKPYHTIKDDFTVSKAITGGLVPSLKPEKPYAPPCLNEHLWDVVRSCWSQLDFRPTATRLLNELNRLMEQKLVDTSPITPDRNSIDFDGTLPDWPVKIEDFGPLRGGAREEVINSSRRAEVRIRYAESEPLQVFNLSIFNISLGQGIGTNTEGQRTSAYVIKAPNPPRRKSSRTTKLDPFLYLLKRMIRERYSLQHQNIVEMIGFDSSFGLYPGLVFEYCENSSLEKYAARVAGNEYTHIRYMIHILEGLRHLHTFPTPIAHGDLNPSNILVDANGTLKLTLFSLSRLAADMPRAEESSSLIDFVESIRYFSPESLHVEARPSIWADIWAFGCIVFWIHTKLRPYHEVREETEVEVLIRKGEAPNSSQILREEEDMFVSKRTNTWLVNGISDWAERCWSGTSRPTATEFLKFVKGFPSEMEAEVGMWSLGITNLSGSIIRAKVPLGYGGSNGVWRHTRISREKPGQNVIGVRLYWMNASFRRGIFRIQTQMSVKYSTHTDSHNGSEAFVAAQASMKHELSILTQLKHSNVGSLWGYEEDTYGSMRMPAIVTEFYENGSLHEYISRHSQELSTLERIVLMDNILKGLNYLHEQVAKGPVVHGNLNMDSIAIDKFGIPKLRNFEFSVQYMRSTGRGVLATLIQMPALVPRPSRWHPPEMFVKVKGNNWPLATRYTDLWAVGCVLVAIITEHEPYPGTDVPAVFAKIASREIPYTGDSCANIEIWEIAQQLWGKTVIDRMSAAKALEAIQRCM